MIDSISDIFEIAAARYLSAVDADRDRSNQHEIGGLPSVGFKQVLGTPDKSEKYYYPCTMAYITDDEDPVEIVNDEVSWYDCRWKNANRRPEYRLYYRDNLVTLNIAEGDLMVIAKKKTGDLVLLFAPQDSSASLQLQYLFGLPSALRLEFDKAEMPAQSLSLPIKYLLEDIGVEAIEPDDEGNDLEIMLQRFANRFPPTSEFSKLARELEPADPRAQPDQSLLAWMEREEMLFRTYERHVVSERLCQGFGPNGDDVDEFISFSLSVQNRRKSRVGHAFEHHLGQVFSEHGLRFEKGSGKKVTENKSKPDFMFPGFGEYHDPEFPESKLFLLGAKTTCKDRWRQVLSEGQRLMKKHLATIEPGITETQTNEMKAQGLQLVVPEPVQNSYNGDQQRWLASLIDFITEVQQS